MDRNLKNNVMFACNQGGHFSQMMALSELFERYDSVLVTDNVRATKETPALNKIGQIIHIKTQRDKVKAGKSHRLFYINVYVGNFIKYWKAWKQIRPKVIISTGSNIAVPLFWIGKLHGSKLIFIETRAKVYARSLTGILVRNIADIIYVQWPEMLKLYPEAKYCGTLV